MAESAGRAMLRATTPPAMRALPALVLAALALAGPVSAQCSARDVDVGALEAPFVLATARGGEIARAGLPLVETEALRVYVVGTADQLAALTVQRASPTRDPNAVRVVGLPETLDFVSPAPPPEPRPACVVDRYVLSDFGPPEGRVAFDRVVPTPGGVVTVRSEIPFGVLAVVRGAVSFGPLGSSLPERDYAVVGEPGRRTLAASENDIDLDYAVAFTYYLGGPRVRDGRAAPGVFVAVPVTGALGDNAFVGASLDLGTLFLVHAGVRLGRVERLVGPDLVGASVPDDFEPVTAAVWRAGLALGVSVDAAAAVGAFANVARSFAGR